MLTAECQQTKIVFVFDEARSLVSQVVKHGEKTTNSFHLLRSALSEFKSGSLFALFMDTTSQVANFPPTLAFDPSAREPKKGKELFFPFTFLPGQGVLEVTNTFCREHREVLPFGDSKLRYNRFDEAALSRPMFAARINMRAKYRSIAQTDSEAVRSLWSDLIELGRSKVLPNLNAGQKEQLDSTMVVMAMRFCLLPMDANTRVELVASRLATLQAVSEDRSRLSIRYEAEPILGEVACEHMCDGDNFRKCLSQLVEMRRTGNVGVLYPSGEVGELCCSLQLARAIDKVHLSDNKLDFTHFGAPVSLRSFLASLLDKNCAEKLILPGGLENAAIRFMQFVKCEGPITKEMLLTAFQRGVALFCMNGGVAMDIVLPVVLLESGQDKDVATLTVSDMSGVFVQCKNNACTAMGPAEVVSAAIGLHDAAESVLEHDDDVTPPFVSLIMDVGLAKATTTPSFRDWDKVLLDAKAMAEKKRDDYAQLQDTAEFKQTKLDTLDAKVATLTAMTQAMVPSRGPTAVYRRWATSTRVLRRRSLRC